MTKNDQEHRLISSRPPTLGTSTGASRAVLQPFVQDLVQSLFKSLVTLDQCVIFCPTGHWARPARCIPLRAECFDDDDAWRRHRISKKFPARYSRLAVRSSREQPLGTPKSRLPAFVRQRVSNRSEWCPDALRRERSARPRSPSARPAGPVGRLGLGRFGLGRFGRGRFGIGYFGLRTVLLQFLQFLR